MLKIDFKVKTKLISKLLEDENISAVSKPSFFQKLSGSKEFASIYFHSGDLDKEAIEKIAKAKKVIVTSLTTRHQLLKQLDTDPEKIEVIYPSIDIEYEKPKDVKKRVCENLGIDPKRKLVFFTGKNLKSYGVKEFISIIMHLNNSNYLAIIASDKKQTYNLRFQLSKLDLDDKLLLVEDYENVDELFLASDIFVLPTYTKNFASNILKAMYCKCAVFVTATNAAKEVVDVFSMMETPDDRSMQFKVSALLNNEDDLKLIKKQNRKIAKDYTLEKALNKFYNILEKAEI